MRTIDLENWPRSEHFKKFSAFDHPHFGLCANVDLTVFFPALKKHNIPFTIGTVYVIARAANAIPEFRYRIRSGQVVELDVVHPSFTAQSVGDLFGFCSIDYTENFKLFATRAAEQIAYVKENLVLQDESGRDDMLFMSAIPWISFISFRHPMHLTPPDSIPRIAWGKYFWEGSSLKMPLDVQGHHALMDGIHMARFYELVQNLFDHPQYLR